MLNKAALSLSDFEFLFLLFFFLKQFNETLRDKIIHRNWYTNLCINNLMKNIHYYSKNLILYEE